MMSEDVKVDVGVLKVKVLTLTELCGKMDKVMEKLVDQHDRHISKVYSDMDNRRLETEANIKEIHDRIDSVLDKLQDSERRITEELKSLRADLTAQIKSEKDAIQKLNEWKWMIGGAIVVISWLLSRINTDMIRGIFIK
jgi:DNA repair exonuclease SbcCD ATPase subunit